MSDDKLTTTKQKLRWYRPTPGRISIFVILLGILSLMPSIFRKPSCILKVPTYYGVSTNGHDNNIFLKYDYDIMTCIYIDNHGKGLVDSVIYFSLTGKPSKYTRDTDGDGFQDWQYDFANGTESVVDKNDVALTGPFLVKDLNEVIQSSQHHPPPRLAKPPNDK